MDFVWAVCVLAAMSRVSLKTVASVHLGSEHQPPVWKRDTLSTQRHTLAMQLATLTLTNLATQLATLATQVAMIATKVATLAQQAFASHLHSAILK